MGNFESLRLDISLAQDGSGHPDATFNKVYGYVQDKLVEKMGEIEAELKE